MHIKSTVTFVLWMISAILWADPVIVTPKLPAEISFPPGETVCYAAKFLQMHIRAATGKNLAIIPESEAEKYAERIWIGNTRFSAQNLGEIRFQPEELLIQSVDSDSAEKSLRRELTGERFSPSTNIWNGHWGSVGSLLIFRHCIRTDSALSFRSEWN